MTAAVALPSGEQLHLVDPARVAGVDGYALRRYQDHVARWAHCAPAGACFLPAPFTGWHGEPHARRGSLSVGPCKALREARAARGLHPFTGERAVV